MQLADVKPGDRVTVTANSDYNGYAGEVIGFSRCGKPLTPAQALRCKSVVRVDVKFTSWAGGALTLSPPFGMALLAQSLEKIA